MPKEADPIQIKISSDAMQATLVISRSADPSALTIENLKAMLQSNGVVSGIDEGALASSLDKANRGKQIIVANGAPAEKGIDATIEYFFETERVGLPRIDASGRVNNKELGLIRNTEKGQKLAKITEAAEGNPGMGVNGKTINPPPVKSYGKVNGANTEFTASDPQLLVSTIEGNIVLQKEGTIEVQAAVTIRGDVDYSVGNIDFIGSLIVMGDVKGDFHIKTKKSIIIFGNVQDTNIEAGENLTIHKGYVGHGNGKISAQGTVKVHHVMNQTVYSEKEIIIEKEAINARVETKGRVLSPQASVVGGFLEAFEGVEVKNLGSSEGAKTNVRVGRRGKLVEMLNQIEKEIKQNEKQVGEVKDAIYKITMVQMNTGKLDPARQELLGKLHAAQKSLPLQMDIFLKEKEEIVHGLTKEIDASITVRGVVHQSVILEINGAKKLIESELSEVKFIKNQGIIEAKGI